MTMPSPQLSWLRSFEAAGRLLSFTRAAQELNVSASAVSQQIRSLEERCGKQLFNRERHGVSLTEHGQALLPKISAAFEMMSEGLRELADEPAVTVLDIRTTITLGNLWLMPRLEAFRLENPDIDFRINSPSETRPAFTPATADVEILYFDQGPPAGDARILLKDDLLPVCAPGLVEGQSLPLVPDDHAHYPLIKVSGFEYEWEAWLKHAGQARTPKRAGVSFDQSVMAIHAALTGKGLFLSRRSLVAEELARGALVAPFDISLPSPGAYYLRFRKTGPKRALIDRFGNWLMTSAQTG